MKIRLFQIGGLILTLAMAVPVSAQSARKKNVEKKQETAAVSESASAAVAAAAVQYTGFESKRDPFGLPEMMENLLKKPEAVEGLHIEAVKLPQVNIEGIIYSPTMPQVIIDGTVHSVGDYLDDFEIKEILENGIILFFKGREYKIRMQNTKSKSSRSRSRPKRK